MGKGCVDQVLGVEVYEKYLGNGRDVNVALMGL